MARCFLCGVASLLVVRVCMFLTFNLFIPLCISDIGSGLATDLQRIYNGFGSEEERRRSGFESYLGLRYAKCLIFGSIIKGDIAL